MIRVDLSPIRPVLRLLALGLLSFKTHGLHPLAPYMREAVIRRAELKRPMRERTMR